MIYRDSFQKLGRNAQKAMIVENAISLFVFSAIAIVIYILLHSFHLPDAVFTIYNIIAGIVIFFSIFSLIFEPTVGYHVHRYLINEKSIEKISGIIFITDEVVPIRRIQQISVSQGPVKSRFGLAVLHIVTAGGSITLEYLPLDKAEIIADKLKNEINEFAEKQILKIEDYTGVISSNSNDDNSDQKSPRDDGV